MYLQITTRCNMRCPHCCFSCTDCGTDMTMDTVKQACAIANEHNAMLFIGGGEPCLHPDLFSIIQLITREQKEVYREYGVDIGKPGLVTNGTCTKRTKRLLRMAAQGKVYVRVSNDQYHDRDRVHDDVWAMTTCNRYALIEHTPYDKETGEEIPDCRELRSNDKMMFTDLVGRARDNFVSGSGSSVASFLGLNVCRSCGPHISPDGTIWQCGCQLDKIGHVSTGLTIISDWLSDGMLCSGHMDNPGVKVMAEHTLDDWEAIKDEKRMREEEAEEMGAENVA